MNNTVSSPLHLCQNATGGVADLCGIVLQAQANHDSLQQSIDAAWVILTTIGILAMQAGFTLLESGIVQSKNVKSVLMKNLCDFLFGGVVYWAIGYALYQTDSRHSAFFLGSEQAMDEVDNSAKSVDFMQQYAFAITSVTIVSGAIMSRMRFEHYIIFSLLYMGVLYPICAQWSWRGILANLGFVDFAGSGVVHMTGGFAGLTGSWFLGPRVGRFVPKTSPNAPQVVRPLQPNSPTSMVQGVLLLFIAWFPFNCGSSGGLVGKKLHVASRAMLATALGAVGGGSTAALYSLFVQRQHNVSIICNGILAGLVGVTASAGMLDSWCAMVIGVLCALLFLPVSHAVLYRWSIDDPVDAFTIHGFVGAIACVLQGVFDRDVGLIYTGSFDQVVAQLIGIGVLCSFIVFTTLLLFICLDRFIPGGIRVSEAVQLVGLDMSYHAGFDFPEFDQLSVQERNMQKEERARLIREARKEYHLKSTGKYGRTVPDGVESEISNE